MERRWLTLLVACGCGATVSPDAADSSASDAASTTSSSSTTAGVSPGTESGGATSSTSSEDDGADGAPKLDTLPPDLPPLIESCEVSATEQVDLVVTTPDGPFVATHAWWGWENCCVIDPWLLLTEGDELTYEDGELVTPHVEILLPGTWEHTGAYLGAMPVHIGFDIWDEYETFESGVELLEPLDPVAPHDDTQPDLAASFAIDGVAWSIQGTVRAPHCMLVETEPCPCE